MISEEKITKVFITATPTYVQPSLDTLFVCCNQSIKIFNLQDTTREPDVLDTLNKINSFELNKKKVLVTSPNGDCALHDLTNGFNHSELKILIRSSLSLTDAVFTHGGSMVLCGGQEGKLKLIDIKEGKEIQSIQLEKEIIGISYNNIVDVASIVLSDGTLIFYSFTSAEPERKASIPSIFVDKTSLMLGSMGLDSDDSDDSDSDDDDASTSMFGDNESNMSNKKNLKKELKLTCSKPSWNSNGDLLAVPTKTKEILVYNINDLNKEAYKFNGLKHHSKQITDIKWSDDGKHIATVGLDNKIIIWDVNLKKSVASNLLPTTAFKIVWTSNDSLVISSTKGEIINIDKTAFQSLLKSISIEEEAEEELEEEEDTERNIQTEIQAEGEGEIDEGDDVNMESDEDEAALDRQIEQDDNQDGFIVDDDGSGYVTQKRGYDSITSNSLSTAKKHKSNLKSTSFLPHESAGFSLRSGWGALLTKPYSIGSTPWENDRRYLSINSFGYIWSVKQEGHKSITVSFFDKSLHKEYHFQDNNDLDICNMNENFVLFASTGFKKGIRGFAAKIVFKSHDQDDNKSWEREINLKPYEFVTCVSISLNSCFVCTSKGFIRRYSLFGRLERMEKMSNIIAIMNSEKYVFTVNQRDQFGLYFNIQDLEGRYIQRGLALPLEIDKDGSIKSMFFSNDGDPCIVGQDDILLILTRWRDPFQASWIPILDLKDGVKNLVNGEGIKCWPLGLIGDKFNFIPYKGRKYPFVPLLAPLEMDIRLPVSKSTMEVDVINEDENENNNYDDDDLFGENARKKTVKRDDPEEELMRYIVLAELLNESISNDDIEDENAEERLGELSLKYDTAILKQIGESCTNAKLQDAYYLATKLRDDKALVAASKIAERLDLVNLAIKLSKLREARMEEE